MRNPIERKRMVPTMRSGTVDASVSSRYSMRSLSPSGSLLRRPFVTTGSAAGSAGRSQHKRSQSDLRGSTLRTRAGSEPPRSMFGTPRRESRFADSSDDEDTGSPAFQSRFADSSDDEGPVVAAQKSAAQLPGLETGSSGRTGDASAVTFGRPRHKRRGSFLGLLRRGRRETSKPDGGGSVDGGSVDVSAQTRPTTLRRRTLGSDWPLGRGGQADTSVNGSVGSASGGRVAGAAADETRRKRFRLLRRALGLAA
jgi:hypothetical protein